ncbi:EAL domain-containing protein [Daeguia caeni]|uniref:EAL domain-containing protein n=1 Tax=Daeguia caeni TaxID=439612 RepID=A0ABV9H7D8_9HYPH
MGKRLGFLLESAIKSGEIRPYFQPIVRLSDRRIVGFEILSRWHRRDGSILQPLEFIPLAEERGLIGNLTESVLRQSLSAIEHLPKDLFLSLNISPSQLKNTSILRIIKDAAADYGFFLPRLKIEITETALIEDTDLAKATILELMQLGCHIAMDDFGTGYSSLSWLQHLPIDTIKIDASFVGSMLTERESRKIVMAIISLGQSLDIGVVAEGVETEEQAEVLQRAGCQMAQGYYFGKPGPILNVDLPACEEPVLQAGIPNHGLTVEQRAYQIAAIYTDNNTCMGFVDPDFQIIDISRKFAKALGSTVSALRGTDLASHFNLKQWQVQEIVSTLREKGHYPPFEVRLPNSVQLVSVSPVLDEIGGLLGFSVFGIDVTEKKRQQEILQESEEHYRLIALLSPRAFWQADANGKVIRVDRKFNLTMQTSPDEVNEDHWLEFIFPEDRAKIQAEWQKSVETGEIFEAEFRYCRPDQDVRWLRVYAAPQKDGNDRVLRWFGQCEDITTRKLAEIGLSEREAEFRFLVENSPHLFWIADQRGRFTGINPRLAALFEITSAEAQNFGWLDRVYPEDRAFSGAAFRDCIHQGRPFDIYYRLLLSGGRIQWVRSWGAAKVTDGIITGYYGMVTPIDDKFSNILQEKIDEDTEKYVPTGSNLYL